ncbi:GntR family transcriptional regulator [Streptomyces sparsogenes]|uniref:GntR family transcriptional regulator n=1 Tax=Streptomyces sparsogenes TaxID=67365 RepID=UPI00340ABB61
MQRKGYRDIAAELRNAIEAGEMPPGTLLPNSKELAKAQGVAPATALQALQQLAADGYITLRPKRRAVVRERPRERINVRDRHAYRDAIGYFFDKNAQEWRTVGKPSHRIAPPPNHVADALGVPRGENVVIRDRGVGPKGAERPLQVALSFIPLSVVAEIPAVGGDDTGPGGIYDRFEEHYEAPITWRETVTTRLPTDDEQERLGIAPSQSVLVVTRESTVTPPDRDPIVVEVNETSMSGEMFAVSYTVERDESARWPREERG